jgi:hypothetical protein
MSENGNGNGNDRACAIIFVHLPKCGGTTLNRLIEWEYPPTRVFSVDPSFFRWSYRKLLGWPAKRLGRMMVFQGHMPFGVHRLLPQSATYLTVLRDPIDRGISEYYYALSRVVHPEHRKMKQLSFEEYIKATPYANVQTKLIAGQDPGYDFLGGDCTAATLAQAKENLAKHFSLVGLTERFEETLALAKIIFGWQVRNYASFNVTKGRPRKDDVPAEIRAAIGEQYRYDVELYDYAKGLFEENLARHADRVRVELTTIEQAKAQATSESYYFRGASAARKAISRLHSYINV